MIPVTFIAITIGTISSLLAWRVYVAHVDRQEADLARTVKQMRTRMDQGEAGYCEVGTVIVPIGRSATIRMRSDRGALCRISGVTYQGEPHARIDQIPENGQLAAVVLSELPAELARDSADG